MRTQHRITMQSSAAARAVLLLLISANLSPLALTGDGIPAPPLNILVNSPDFQTVDFLLYDFGPGPVGTTYRLLHTPLCPSGTFSIDSSTGQMVIAQTIEFTAENATTRCVDTPLGFVQSIRTYSCFTVIEDLTQSHTVLAVVDVLPIFPDTQIEFPQEFYSSEIPEIAHSAHALLAGGIQATTLPIPGLLSPSYRIINSSPFAASTATINCKTFVEIHVIEPLDREQQSYHEVILEAYTNAFAVNTTIRVYVLDGNDNDPVFVTPADSVTVNQSLLVGEIVTQFQAEDKDTGINAALFYSLKTESTTFTVNPLTGRLYRYSYQALTQTTESVEVQDTGNPLRTSQVDFTIFITEEDQHSIIIHPLGQLSVSEGEVTGYDVTTIQLSSSFSNSPTVRLESLDCLCFQLSSPVLVATGEYETVLSVRSALDHESYPDGVRITITASDTNNGSFSTSQEVTISITDENETPVFPLDHYDVSILEGLPVGSEVFHVRATDQDSGINGDLTYTVMDGSASFLSLDSTTGLLQTTQIIDYDSTTNVALTVLVEDGGGETDSMTLSVEILDQNNHPPIFTHSGRSVSISVPETTQENNSIFGFSATDADFECNGGITYSIVHASPPVFQIDSMSGLLYPASDDSLDYEGFQTANVIVRATDLGETSYNFNDINLLISITDVNDETPVIDEILCPCFIEETSTELQQCQRLSAHDRDSTDISFSIQSGNELGLFEIDAMTGIVSTSVELHYENNATHSLRIVAYDDEFYSNPQTLHIIIVDKNDRGPIYPSSITLTVPVDTPVGSLVADLSAEHNDAGYNAITEYEFSGSIQQDILNAFTLDALSGFLYLKSSIVGDTSYSFTLTATDTGNPQQASTVQVSITFSGQRNTAPYFQSSVDHIDVANQAEVGNLYQIMANDDDDESGQLLYSLVSNSTIFNVNSNGQLILLKSLESEIESEFSIVIVVSDGGSPPLSATQELIITVYNSEEVIGGQQFVYNPGHGVGHDIVTINEGSIHPMFVSSLPSIPGAEISYTILPQGQHYAAFTIHNGNQVMSESGFESVFDREQNEVVFLTIRGQFNLNFFHFSLSVVIGDANDNGPSFDQEQYSVQIYEELPEGSFIFEIPATDPDIGTNAISTYSIIPSTTTFGIAPNTRFIEITSSVTASVSPLIITVVAEDSELGLSATAMLVVTILERTNSAPSITTDPGSIVVSESAQLGSIVTSLIVNDPDTGLHADNTLCIASGNTQDHFRLNQNGEIVVQKQLDHESWPFYILTIQAHDSSPNPKSTITQITLNITNENESPTFTFTSFFGTVVENSPSHTPVLTVSAVDPDSDSNNQVLYTLETATNFFEIHQTSGLISTTTSSLNREFLDFHTLTVVAEDAAGMMSTCIAEISVLDVNDNAPTFNIPNIIIVNEEMAIVGTEVLLLEARDMDLGANATVQFRIVSGNDDATFSLDPVTGSVTLGRDLDSEMDPQSYQVVFAVEDTGTPPLSSSPMQVTFNLENSNDNYPTFSSALYTCSIAENSNAFNPTCQAIATDADIENNDTFTYSIVSGNFNGAFDIDSQSGIVSLQVLLDRESISSYVLVVRAVDEGFPPLSSTAVVIIEVEDVNDNVPIFDPLIALHLPESEKSGLSNVSFPELLPSNTLLFYAHAVDYDTGENGQITYSIVYDASNLFRIDPTTSAVFLRESFDFETEQTHELGIQATNPSGTSSSQYYTIDVLNIYENISPPMFSLDTPSVIKVSTVTEIGTEVLVMNATDSDSEPEGEVMYYIIGGSGYGYFDINNFNGSLTIVYVLTGIETADVTLQIVAQDQGSPQLSTTFYLLIILEPDVRAKPFFIQPQFSVSASEILSSVGRVFANIQATVNDYPITDITYCIVSGNEEDKFSLNSSTGALSVNAMISHEDQSIYTLIVNASRAANTNPSIALVAITVEDHNDFRPSFDVSFDSTIFTNQPTSSNNPFIRVFAVDQDIGTNGQLSYSLTSGGDAFAIDSNSGDIYLTQSLPNSATSYSLTVMTADMGAQSLTSSVDVTITVTSPATTTNNNAPFFSPSSQTLEVAENATTGTLLFTAQATDNDILVYAFLETNEKFSILPNSGEIYLIQPLNREEDNEYTLQIEASDGRLSSSTFLLTISVTDVNDNRPQFTDDDYLFTVSENTTVGILVGSVVADDRDSGANSEVTYSLVDSEYPSSLQLFSLTPGGTVLVSGSIDREEIPIHKLTVAAEDAGDPSLMSYSRVTINVTDINDHHPMIYSLPTVWVSDNITVGETIFTLPTFDPDTGVRVSLEYVLQSPTPIPFRLEESSGEIFLTSQLNATKEDAYLLVIGVGSETFSLEVKLVDELNSLPLLNNPGSVFLPENQPAFSVAATVADRVSSHTIYYDIISGNDGSFFIEPLTGVIRLAQPLDREKTAVYSLTVQGAFGPGYEATITFTVSVTDENDEAPKFFNRYMEYSLPEDSSLTTPVLQLDITDDDSGANSQFGQYLIVDGQAADTFSVDTSGNLNLLQPLDREGKFDTISFELYIFDSGTPPLWDVARVSITVSDINDNPPHFSKSSYHFVVSLPVVVDSVLYQVSAEDPDESGSVQYSISGGNGTNKFSIDSLTGEISIRDNYQLQSYYSLLVTARDGGGNDASVYVNITTKECGFQNILFEPRNILIHISEDAQINTVIFEPNLRVFGQNSNFMYYFSVSDSFFEINSNSGAVSLEQMLNRELEDSHYLSVQVRDQNLPARIAQADIEILVSDVNDNAPVFDQVSYTAYVRDSDTTGSPVIRVLAQDADEGSNGEVTYSISSGPVDFFSISEYSGQITLLAPLNTEVLGVVIVLTVESSDSGTISLTASTTVTVNVVDSNAPIFTMNGAYSIAVPESTPKDIEIFTVIANATSLSPIITYEIESPPPSNLPFSLSFFTGAVTVNDIGLDYESSKSYQLQLRATDLSTSLVGRATLNIQINDVNDNRPEFNMAFYEETLPENSPVGSLVATVNATDADSGLNAVITYYIDPSDSLVNALFTVHSSNGIITTSQEIDWEQHPSFEFSIVAEDCGDSPLTSSATVRLAIININDNAPGFLEPSYHEVVAEDASAGTSILFVVATDPDEDDLVYEIEPGEGSENFDIRSSGLLTLATSAEMLSLLEYNLNISVTDGQFYGYTLVTIELENQNNNAPFFNNTMYNAYIAENASVGMYVTQVYATDADRGSNGEISYTTSDDRFSVNLETGVIRVSGLVDREATFNGSIVLIVIARDGGGRIGTAEVHINLGDVNDNSPTFSSSSYIIDVSETISIGTTVSTVVTATDPDEGENGLIHYSTAEEDNFQFPFSIDLLTGAIITRTAVDFDVASMYSFMVSATDNGSPPLTASPPANVTVNILDDAVMPVTFQNSTYTVEVEEGALLGHLLTVALREGAPCLSTTFEIVSDPSAGLTISNGNANDLQAEIWLQTCSNMNGGQRSCFNFEIIQSYLVTIDAMCTYFSEAMLTTSVAFGLVNIQVIDLNDPPTFNELFLISSIMEGVQPPAILELHNRLQTQVFIAVSASDEDAEDIVQYSIESDFQSIPFSIGVTSGIIMVDVELDRETISEYGFTVIATDMRNPSLTASLFIGVNILDANDSPPVFEQIVYYVFISEDAISGDHVITLTVSDADTEIFSQSIFSLSGGVYFRIPNNSIGEIVTARELDRETLAVHTIEVFAHDAGGEDNATIIVTVLDVNDNSPKFNQSQYEIELPENFAVGEPILQVLATDADEGENAEIVYSVLEDQQLIDIDNSTGEISFAETPDYESSPQGHYEFQLRATNVGDGSLRDLVPLVIQLLDLNDNFPEFSQEISTAEVEENRPIGTLVTRVEAVDADSGLNGTVVYALNAEVDELFAIDSGVITTKIVFNREVEAHFEITVIASDMGDPALSSNTSVLLSILDENDNPPIFQQVNYTEHVRELEDVDTVILNVCADDADAGSNAEITYRLTGVNSGHFSLAPQQDGSVDIRVATSLNHEQVPMYYLSLIAFDGGFPVRETSAVLIIIVQDENDNPPVFTPPFYTVTLLENVTIGYEIVRVLATDQDTIEEVPLVYSIIDNENFREFAIDSDGSVTVVESLDYEVHQSYLIFVQADDQQFTASATVIIIVENVNDNAPEFSMSNYSKTIVENSPVTQLFNFTVEDADIGATPETVSFKIESGNNDGIFSLHPTQGNLSVQPNVDFESLSTGEYFLVITANDNEDQPLKGTAYVTITVEDLNDNPPVGENQTLFIYLYNGQLGLDSLGTLSIRDPDTVNDHLYSVSGISEAFSINSSGFINIIQSPLPVGVNTFTVHVTDGDLGSATTQVSIAVISITDSHLASSFMMEVVSSSAESFLDVHLRPLLAKIEDLVAKSGTTLLPKAHIYAIDTSQRLRNVLDLTVVVENGDGGFVHPSLVQHLLHINRDDILGEMGLEVLTEHVDFCTDDSVCPDGLTCVEEHQYNPSNDVLSSAAATLVGLDQSTSTTCLPPSTICSIPCPEPSHCIQQNGESVCLDDCSSNPCRNSGECIPQNPGYYCSCPTGFDGRNCELKGAYFEDDSYALFPALQSPSNGTIRFEFTTSDRDGLLLFSSRFDKTQSDFMALEMINSQLSLLVSYGGEARRVSLQSPLTQSNWNTAEIQYSPTVVLMTVKTFSPYTIQERQIDITSGSTYRSLDLGGPLIVGSFPDDFNYNYDQRTYQSLTFCVQELTVNGVLQDFSDTLAAHEVSASCALTDAQCTPNPCKNGGLCRGQPNAFTCVCPPEFAGPTCSISSESVSFNGDNFIQYTVGRSFSKRRAVRQVTTYQTGRSFISLAFASTSSMGTLLLLGDTTQGDKYAVLKVVNGYLEFQFNLGSGEAVATVSTIRVDDGDTHTATVEREEQTATLLVDGLYIAHATSPGSSNTLDISSDEIYLGASVDSDGKATNGFKGCIIGAKLDWKDLPLGSSSNDFTASTSEGVEFGCSLGTPSTEGAFPTVISVAAGVVGFIVFIIALPLGIIICAVGIHYYKKRKNRYKPRDRLRSTGSPTFNWQPVGMDRGDSNAQLMSTQQSDASVFAESLHEMNSSHYRNGSSVLSPSTPELSETVFTASEQTPEQPNRQQRQQHRQRSNYQREHQESPQDEQLQPQRSTQSNLQRNWREPEVPHVEMVSIQHQQQQPIATTQQREPSRMQTKIQRNTTRASPEEPTIPATQSELARQTSAVSEAPPPYTHQRSASGHLSIMTTATVKSMGSVFDDSEVGKFVWKRIEAANTYLEEDRDEVTTFKHEGEFEPLGSVGSLYDILKEADDNFGPLDKWPSPPPPPPTDQSPLLKQKSVLTGQNHTHQPNQFLTEKPASHSIAPQPRPLQPEVINTPHSSLLSHPKPTLKPKPVLSEKPLSSIPPHPRTPPNPKPASTDIPPPSVLHRARPSSKPKPASTDLPPSSMPPHKKPPLKPKPQVTDTMSTSVPSPQRPSIKPKPVVVELPPSLKQQLEANKATDSHNTSQSVNNGREHFEKFNEPPEKEPMVTGDLKLRIDHSQNNKSPTELTQSVPSSQNSDPASSFAKNSPPSQPPDKGSRAQRRRAGGRRVAAGPGESLMDRFQSMAPGSQNSQEWDKGRLV